MKNRAPLESPVTTAILKTLNALPDTYAVKLHGSMYGRVGTPDILVVRLRAWEGEPILGEYGQAYFLEVKRPGAKPTPAQLAEMAKWTDVGAVCCVVRSVQEALDAVG